MAQLKNLTISDTGYLNTAIGTTAQRPTVATITAGGSTSLGVAVDGLQLYIPATPWCQYQGLPDYLKGLRCTRSINDGAISVTFGQTTRVYQMWHTTWGNPGLFANTVETGKNYLSTYSSSINVYYADYAAGTYTLQTSSAMYFFSPVAAGNTIAVGAMRYNSTTYETEVWDGSEWLAVNGNVGATSTGGTISGAVLGAGGYRIHTFTSNGTFTPAYSGTVEVLVVGGGGGGTGLGGGGGAGGVVYTNSFQVVGGVGYPIVIGTGGTGASTHTSNTQTPGTPSSFGGPQAASGIIATGGGKGSSYPSGAAGDPGGSGGGGSGGSPNGQRLGGTGILGQGHPGGYGHHGSGPAQGLQPQPGICIYGGGGGGGAGEAGIPRFSWRADAKGGDGLASSISGSSQYYGGGGAGGTHGPSGNYGRDNNSAGLGGGGISLSTGPQAALDGLANTGGGGAGAHHPDGFRSGNGGTGIVVVRYRT